MKNKRHLTAVRSALVVFFLSIGFAGNARAAPLTPIDGQDGLKIDLAHLSGFSTVENAKLKQSIELIDQVFNSQEFHQKVLDFTFNGKPQFANNNNLTNEQVYEQIMKGHETYSAADDHVAQLDLNLYNPPWYKKKSVIGYGYAGHPEIYMNHYWFQRFTVQEVAGNIAHEWMHKLGFDHDFNRTAQRPYSVPYAVGNIMIELSTNANN
ncbi:hypothetical protein WDW37_13685 [Bdellovibrionota bacterium FG-1]